jgi:hypothetical protein
LICINGRAIVHDRSARKGDLGVYELKEVTAAFAAGGSRSVSLNIRAAPGRVNLCREDSAGSPPSARDEGRMITAVGPARQPDRDTDSAAGLQSRVLSELALSTRYEKHLSTLSGDAKAVRAPADLQEIIPAALEAFLLNGERPRYLFAVEPDGPLFELLVRVAARARQLQTDE